MMTTDAIPSFHFPFTNASKIVCSLSGESATSVVSSAYLEVVDAFLLLIFLI